MDRDDFPVVEMATPPTPTGQIPTPSPIGAPYRNPMNKASVYIAIGATVLLILEAVFLFSKTIPAENLDLFKTLTTGTLLYWGLIVKDIFHAEGK
jgi:hypothetical protein